jgi:plasmid replication initiation protein
MEHPLFALQAGDYRVRVYERQGVSLTIKPGADGCATMHDKDLWLYCISLLVQKLNAGQPVSPTVKFTSYDFMMKTGRDSSGRAYLRMAEMMARLKGTVIETNIETASMRERGGFGLIDSWRVIERNNNRMVAVEVTLPAWLFRSVETMQVLTMSPDYFHLRKPLARRLYELVRKHCGNQTEWIVSLAALHQKSGSTRELKKFRAEIRKLVEENNLPDYSIAFNAERDMVMFERRRHAQTSAPEQLSITLPPALS